MNGIVMKFGGSSVADAACMRQVAEPRAGRLAQRPPGGPVRHGQDHQRPLRRRPGRRSAATWPAPSSGMNAVMATHRKAAEDLFAGRGARKPWTAALAERFGELELLLRGVALLRELSPRSMDAIASFGERLSTLHLRRLHRARPWVDARTGHAHRRHLRRGPAPASPSCRSWPARHFAPLLRPGPARGHPGLHRRHGGGPHHHPGPRAAATTPRPSSARPWASRRSRSGPMSKGVLTCDPRVVPEAQPIDRAHLRRGRGTGRLRRQGAAPRHHPAGGGGRHPGHRAAHPAARRAVHHHLRRTPARAAP